MKDFLETFMPLCRRLNERERFDILSSLWDAHRNSAIENESGSKVVARIIGEGSGSFGHSACGAILSVGSKHGPILEARRVLVGLSPDEAFSIATKGGIIPGFGNSFFRDGIDPAWQGTFNLLALKCRNEIAILMAINEAIGRAGHKIFPNAAGISAVACEALGLPYGIEDAIFIMPRMNVWLSDFILHNALKGEA